MTSFTTEVASSYGRRNGILQPAVSASLRRQRPKPTILPLVVLESTRVGHIDTLPGLQQRGANLGVPVQLWRRLWRAGWREWEDGRTRRLDDGLARGVWDRRIPGRASVVGRVGRQFRAHQDKGLWHGERRCGMRDADLMRQTLTVLNPLARIDQHIMDDSDLAGPILFFLLFGTFLLLVCDAKRAWLDIG